jgi:hypothetical protein
MIRRVEDDSFIRLFCFVAVIRVWPSYRRKSAVESSRGYFLQKVKFFTNFA